ncbi:MAG TPA: hypothetical protein VD866_19455 [Urbifossiella sp.]|nr:hypothetical protein [Urbifossiella sp.]
MFASLLIAAAAAPAAPLPADTNPAPAGPAPWVLHLKGDDGQLRVMVQRLVSTKQVRTITKNVNGQLVTEQQTVDVQVPQHTQVSLADLDGTVAAADGSPVGPAELVRRARDGVTVLVSADGKAVDRAWLRAVGPNTVVVASKSLGGAMAPPQVLNTGRVLPVGPSPRLTLLTAGPDGTVRVSTQRGTVHYLSTGRMIILNNGAPLMLDDGIGYAGPSNGGTQVRPLSEVGFDAYDLTGKLVARDEAVRRLRAGGLVLVAAGRFPDPVHLQPFRGDLLVLVSNENLTAPGAAPTGPAAPAAPGIEIKPAILRVQPVAAPVLRVAPLRAVPLPAPQAP